MIKETEVEDDRGRSTGVFFYSMLQFNIHKACEYLDANKELSNEFHRRCCLLALKYCIQFYNSDKNEKAQQSFVTVEANVWACVNRAIKKPVEVILGDDNYMPLKKEIKKIEGVGQTISATSIPSSVNLHEIQSPLSDGTEENFANTIDITRKFVQSDLNR